MSDTNFSVVADTTDIEVGHSQSVQFNGVDILICHTEEGFFAVEDLCTHSMIPLCGGQIQGKLVLDDEGKVKAKKLGITDFNKKYNIDDMVKGDVIFCATGVTTGDLAKGVKDLGNEFEVNTFVLHKSQNIIKSVTNIYNK